MSTNRSEEPELIAEIADLALPPTTRRSFLRGLATASAAVGVTAVSGRVPGSADTPAKADTNFGLTSLRHWAAAGADWQVIRQYFLLEPGLTHLNTGSLGASPRAVVESHARFLTELESNPVPLLFGSMGAQMETVRQQAADFLGAGLDEVMLTANTTTGMNLIAAALHLKAGDEVLTSNQEHAGGKVCWEAQQAGTGVVLREFDLNRVKTEADILESIEAALTPRTKVISISHVSTISGLRMPLALISKLAREHGIFLVVDGAQSAGMLDIDLHEMGCDAFATSGHKWMLAPKGTGILYLRKEFQPHLSDVLLKSGLNAYTAASGTRNVPQILAQGTAIDFFNTIGRQRIEKRVLELAAYLRNQLHGIESLEIVSPAYPALQSAMVTLKLPQKGHKTNLPLTPAHVYQTLLDRHKIVVKVVPGEYYEGRGIRISTHFYNSHQEVDLLARSLKEIIQNS